MTEPTTSHEALLQMLDGLIKQAADTLREFGCDGDWENVANCWPEFMELLKNRKDQPRQVAWSAEVIKRAISVRFVLNNPDDYRLTALALNMAKFIQAAERAKFSYYIPDVERGQKSINSAKKGHEAVHGSDEEKQARWKKYQDDLEQAHIDHPTWGIMALRETVAELNCVSSKTIQNHTSKTW